MFWVRVDRLGSVQSGLWSLCFVRCPCVCRPRFAHMSCVPKNGKLSRSRRSFRDRVFENIAIKETGSDELMVLASDLATYIGTGVRPTALPGPGHMQLPTCHAGREVPIFPLRSMQYPTEIGRHGHRSMRARACYQVRGPSGRSSSQKPRDSPESRSLNCCTHETQ